jgi:hypothetical protein
LLNVVVQTLSISS